MKLTVAADSLTATEQLAHRLAAAIVPGTVIALDGPLGAGKTTFVRGFCTALAIDERSVASPTFVLVHQYRGRCEVNHLDAYRIGSIEEFLDLGVDEYFESDAVTIVEWGERVAAALPADRLAMQIEITAADARLFSLTATGPRSEEVLTRLAAASNG